MDFICTWIYLDSPDESSEYPQAGKQSHLADFHHIYWKCVATFFACSTRQNPNCRHVLFSNKTWDEIPVVEGKDVRLLLENFKVELITLPLRWQTPAGYYGKWRNQFYIFDILTYVGAHFEENDRLLVLDSDCLINRPLTKLFETLGSAGLMVLPMDYPDQKEINGITRADMRKIYTALDGFDPGFNPVYYGGEVFAATGALIKRINLMAPDIWSEMQERFAEGTLKFNEEAHFLSYIYYKIGQFELLDRYIKRIWTSPKFNNVADADVLLPIWHLPSEKKGGLALLFRQLGKSNWPDLEPKDLGTYVGIPNRRHWLNWKHYLKYTFIYKWLTNFLGA